MFVLKWLPYSLLAAWMVSIAALAWSIAADSTRVVQATYLIVIALLVITIPIVAASSIAVAVKKCDRYWSSGLPILLIALLLFYGLLKSEPTPLSFAVGFGGFTVGYVAAMFFRRAWLRLLPAAMSVMLLVGGEIAGWDSSGKAAALLVCVGLMVAAILKMRRADADIDWR